MTFSWEPQCPMIGVALRGAAQLEVAVATVLGLLPEQLTITVNAVEQREVDLNFGVYERLLSQKLGSIPPIQ